MTQEKRAEFWKYYYSLAWADQYYLDQTNEEIHRRLAEHNTELAQVAAASTKPDDSAAVIPIAIQV